MKSLGLSKMGGCRERVLMHCKTIVIVCEKPGILWFVDRFIYNYAAVHS